MARPLIVLVAVIAGLIAVTVVAQTQLSTISVSEIQPGMRGYGLTVFRGTEPERFDIEVVDVLHNFRPDMDLILVKTPHPILDRASSVGGMSGSPIFIDGRLAGAYSYGWPFGLDPVAGVTPIASMLGELNRPVRPTSFPGARPLALFPRPSQPNTPTRAANVLDPYRGGRRNAFDALNAHATRIGLSERETVGLRPAATPIMLGGFDEAVAEMLAERLEPFGLVPLQAGGNGPATGDPGRFVDGGSIAVELMRGDVSASGVGTVTYVAGRRLVAFGHPMMNAGEVGFPTATSRVLHIMVSRSRSFKVAEAIAPLGTLIHDRQPAIVVDTELAAATVPVVVRLHGIPASPRDEWNFEVSNHRALSPVLVFSGLANAIRTSGADATDVIYTARSRVTIEGQGTIDLTDHGYMPAGPADTTALASMRLFALMEAAYGNPFDDAEVTSVEIDFHAEYSRDVHAIVDAQVPMEEVDPGTTLPVRVVIQRYGRPDDVRIVPVAIPMAAAGETVDILVESGETASLPDPEPRSLAEIIDQIEARFPSTSLVATLEMPSRGLRFRGHVVSSLPPSALDTLQLTTDSARIRPFVTESRQVIDVGQVVSGFARVRVDVRETPER